MSFPLKDSDAYIESTGKRSTLGKKLSGGGYELPTASNNTKGGVKIGTGLKMTGEVLSATQVPNHTISDAGKVLTVGDTGDLEWHESGGAGGDVVVYNEIYMKTESGGSAVPFEKSYTVEESGTYQILFCGYCSPLTLKINNIDESIDVSNSNNYAYFYLKNKQLALNDVISFTGSAEGKAYVIAQVIKLEDEV